MPEIGHELNPYDSCAVNKIINTKQHALLWHADNVKALRADPKVNDKFAEQAELACRSDELGHAKVCRSKKYNCLGITLDYLSRGTFEVNMTDYVDTLKENFPCKTNKTLKAQNDKLFLVNTNSSRLGKEKYDVFHEFTIKCMFLCKR